MLSHSTFAATVAAAALLEPTRGSIPTPARAAPPVTRNCLRLIGVRPVGWSHPLELTEGSVAVGAVSRVARATKSSPSIGRIGLFIGRPRSMD